jgi:hypothetical protein
MIGRIETHFHLPTERTEPDTLAYDNSCRRASVLLA